MEEGGRRGRKIYSGGILMEEIKEKKRAIREDINKKLLSFKDGDLEEKNRLIETQLFGFANFIESKIPLLYINGENEVKTWNIIKLCYDHGKMVILPIFGKDKYKLKLLKVDNPDTDLKTGHGGILEPDAGKCKEVPIECIDIAIIPSIAMDEKGGRIGSADGHYDRLIPQLPITARKVALAMECQVIPHVPMESHDRHVDIVVTEERIIYKI